MRIETKSALETLTIKNSPCLGAFFCTYTLDTRFFEEKILSELLDIRSDPQEQAMKYLEDTRSRLREIPLVCVADGRMYSGGHRLPYDLLLVNKRTFHPKIYLILFERSARLMLGSGNLTEEGFGGNSEIFQCLELYYDDRHDRSILQDADNFINTVPDLVEKPGRHTNEFREQLNRLCPYMSDNEPVDRISFIQSESDGPLLEKYLSLIPERHTVTGVGLLAPFYEVDGDEMEASVVLQLRDFALSRGHNEISFNMGLPWNDPPLGLKGEKITSLEKEFDKLWCWKEGEGKDAVVSYFIPTRTTASKLFYVDQHGKNRSWELESFQSAIEDGMAWPVGMVKTFGPSGLLKEVVESCPEASYWIFPDRRIDNGELVHRPLHAKLYTVTTIYRRKYYTHIMIGSPNASRRALVYEPPMSNVETALVLTIEGDYALSKLAPLLVKCPDSQIELSDREFTPPETNWARVISSATYNAENEKLTVKWNHSMAEKAFVLLYMEQNLYEGTVPEDQASNWDGIQLKQSSCELTIVVNGRNYYVPIHIEDIEHLPVNPFLVTLGLEELLAYFSGRMTLEGLSILRERAAKGETVDTGLQFVFGERFQPVDVFKAWFGMKEDLEDSLLTVGGFRVILEGRVGVQVIWKRMTDAVSGEKVSKEEAWVYGLELYRTLSMIEFEDTLAEREKAKILLDWLITLKQSLKRMKPSAQKHPWIRDVAKFYGVRK